LANSVVSLFCATWAPDQPITLLSLSRARLAKIKIKINGRVEYSWQVGQVGTSIIILFQISLFHFNVNQEPPSCSTIYIYIYISPRPAPNGQSIGFADYGGRQAWAKPWLQMSTDYSAVRRNVSEQSALLHIPNIYYLYVYTS